MIKHFCDNCGTELKKENQFLNLDDLENFGVSLRLSKEQKEAEVCKMCALIIVIQAFIKPNNKIKLDQSFKLISGGSGGCSTTSSEYIDEILDFVIDEIRSGRTLVQIGELKK